MKNILKIFFLSLIGGAAVVVGGYIAAFLGVAAPTDVLVQFFERFGITYSYDFNTFGEVFRFWSAAALFPMTGELLVTSSSLLGSIIPIVVFAVVCFFIGYLYKLPDGISVSILVFLWTIIIGVVAAALVPHTLPAVGLSPSDYAYIRGLADELILFTIIAPPNMIVGTSITLGVGVLAAIVGGIFYRLPISNLFKKTSKKKKTQRKTTSKKTTKKTAKKKTSK